MGVYLILGWFATLLASGVIATLLVLHRQPPRIGRAVLAFLGGIAMFAYVAMGIGLLEGTLRLTSPGFRITALLGTIGLAAFVFAYMGLRATKPGP